MVFSRKTKKVKGESKPSGFPEAIDTAVFPSLQGGPHEHQIAAVATQLLEVASPEWKAYAKQVKANMKRFSDSIISKGYTVVTGGTDNHLILWDVRPQGLTGGKMEKVLDACAITVNKNTVVGDKSAMNPGGVRIGTPSVTSRGMVEADMEVIAGFYDRATKIAQQIQKASGPKLKDFEQHLAKNADLKDMKKEVQEFAGQFPVPGINKSELAD
jgi:glycine hydroxymethyltransferase